MVSVLGRFYANEAPPPPPAPVEAKFFTQEEVNAMMAEHKRSLQKQVQELSQVAQDLPKYQAKVKELSDSLLTKEELARQEAERRKLEYDTAVQNATKETETWRSKFMDTTFDVQLSNAAAKNDAYDPEQLAMLIKPLCKTVEVTDANGAGTGRYQVMMTIEESGKPLTLPINDGIAKLKEMNKYPNQFKTGKIPGTGGSNFSGGLATGQTPGVPSTVHDFLKLTRNMKASGTL